MTLSTRLKEIKPRENSGSVSSNRFDFQKNWAICKLLELTQAKSDFILAFEFHEDILVFDSSNEPSQVEFYQIKSKNTRGKFTLTQLLARTGEKNSILGKLLQNKFNFFNETKSLNLVTNCEYGFNNSQNSVFCCADLAPGDLLKLQKTLESELNINDLKEYLDSLFFERTDLTIEHHSEITKDKLERTLEKKFTSDLRYNPLLAYRTIYDEVRRKNNIERQINSFDEIIKYKSISKSDFEEMLKIVAVEPNRFQVLQDRIFNALDSSNISTSERIKLTNAFKDIKIESFKIDNPFFKESCKLVKQCIKENVNSVDMPLVESLKILMDRVKQIPSLRNQHIYDDYFLKGIILKEIYDE